MNRKERKGVTEQKGGYWQRVYILSARIIQWIVGLATVIFSILLLSAALNLLGKGVNASYSLASTALMLCVAACFLPPIFFKIPGKLKLAPYISVVPAFIVVMICYNQAMDAYHRTPKGAAEAKLEAAQEAKEEQEAKKNEEEVRQQAQAEAASEAAEAKEAEKTASLDRIKKCVIWGKIPALVKEVRENIRNPHSFEHVRTEIQYDSADGPVAVMVFRGQNGFGGMNVESVQASVDPSDCSVSNVKFLDEER